MLVQMLVKADVFSTHETNKPIFHKESWEDFNLPVGEWSDTTQLCCEIAADELAKYPRAGCVRVSLYNDQMQFVNSKLVYREQLQFVQHEQPQGTSFGQYLMYLLIAIVVIIMFLFSISK